MFEGCLKVGFEGGLVSNCRMEVEKIPNGVDGAATEGISLEIYLVGIQPVHHDVIINAGLFDFRDCLGGVEVAANCHKVLMCRGF